MLSTLRSGYGRLFSRHSPDEPLERRKTYHSAGLRGSDFQREATTNSEREQGNEGGQKSSGATGYSGRFNEGLCLRRLH